MNLNERIHITVYYFWYQMSQKREPVSPVNKLRRAIARLWVNEIQALYNKGLICSEAHLQAELFSSLKKKLSAKNNFHIWVEALIPQFDQLKIDLLVTHEQMIIGVIELKYIPHGFPRYENNFQKFEKLQDQKTIRLNLKQNPVSGLDDYRIHFTFDENCLFVFAAIARYNADAFHDKAWERLAGNKLMLTGKVDSPDAKLFEVDPEFGRR